MGGRFTDRRSSATSSTHKSAKPSVIKVRQHEMPNEVHHQIVIFDCALLYSHMSPRIWEHLRFQNRRAPNVREFWIIVRRWQNERITQGRQQSPALKYPIGADGAGV